MTKSQKSYQDFLIQESNVPFYHHAWWLDACCGPDAWDVVLHKNKANEVTASLAYFHQKKYGFSLLRQAILTPYMGPVMTYPHNISKQTSKIALEKKVYSSLIKQLPHYDFFNQNFSSQTKNILPFYWQGLIAEVRYAYRVDLSIGLDKIFEQVEASVRTGVRKAETQLQFKTTDDLARFFALTKKSFDHYDNQLPYSQELFERIVVAAQKQNKAELYITEDKQGKWHSGAFIINDLGKIYTIIIGSDPMLRSSGAVQYLIWEIIKKHHSASDLLDFCGSMIERIEPIFRSFGADQCPYYQVSHPKTKKYQLAQFAKSIWA